MSTTNKDIVRNYLEASAKGEKIDLSKIFDENLEILEAPSLPYGGTHRGIAGFEALVPRVFSTWKDMGLELETIVADGDYVIVFATMTGTGKVSGKSFSMPISELWKFKNGKVVQIKPYYYDTKALSEVDPV